MKKIYFTALSAFVALGAIAQSKMQTVDGAQRYAHTPSVKSAALGDTLFLFDVDAFYITDPQDQNDFDYMNVDVDQLTPNNTPNYDTDWNFWYSLEASNLIPNWDTDTAYYMSATSWFNPAGQADNWFTFGPITIPQGGAQLRFHNKSNPAFTDGFSIYVSETGLDPYVDFDPVSDSPIYVKPDCNANPGVNCTPPDSDTAWAQDHASLSLWAGSRVYVAFHHNTDDGDVCYLDQLTIVETNDVGVDDLSAAGNRLFQNQPNPVNGVSTIKFELAQFNEDIKLDIYDVTGKRVRSLKLGDKQSGVHQVEIDGNQFASGVYYYSLKLDEDLLTRKMVITK